MQLTASHHNASYISVESFEHFIADFFCSSGAGNSSTLVFAFDTLESMTAARNLWSLHSELFFITHHTTCNSLDERAVYKAVLSWDLGSIFAVNGLQGLNNHK